MANMIFLGTGHAMTMRRYHTCWLLEQETLLLVDGGGGHGDGVIIPVIPSCTSKHFKHKKQTGRRRKPSSVFQNHQYDRNAQLDAKPKPA